MSEKLKKIPNAFKVGGQEVEVRFVDRCEGDALGLCHISAGYIEIAENFRKADKQKFDGKVNTFYHELTHAILGTMCKTKLNNDEEFVSTFSSFLTEAMEHAYFADEPRYARARSTMMEAVEKGVISPSQAELVFPELKEGKL